MRRILRFLSAVPLLIAACPLCASPAHPKQPQAAPPDLRDPALIAEGDRLFAKTCSIPYCHGKEGTTGRAPALRDRAWELAELRETILKGIPNSSMLNFDDKLSEKEVWAVISYVLSISQGLAPAEASPTKSRAGEGKAGSEAPDAAVPESLRGDPVRGERLFFESSGDRGCAICHRIDGRGTEAGPDLTGSSRRSAREIFEGIVNPSARVDPAQSAVAITMKDGEKIRGLKKEETPSALRVFDLGSQPPVLRRLAKDRILSAETLNESPMPSRYSEVYSLRQLLDLVAFLKSSGAPLPAHVTYQDIR